MSYQEDLDRFIKFMTSQGGVHLRDNIIEYKNYLLFFEDCNVDCISVGLHNIRIIFPSGKEDIFNYDSLDDIEKYFIYNLRYSDKY